jgi:hypothetical protein
VIVSESAALLDALHDESSSGRILGIARVALHQRDPDAVCSRYFEGLKKSIAENPPPYGDNAYGELYREASADAQWLAISLMTNAEREGDGAGRLWSLAACSTDEPVRQQLKRHAIDESHHALAYLSLLDLVFPGIVAPAFRTQLDELSPRYSMGQAPRPVEGSPYAHAPSLDDFVQMNIAEIRTTIHHSLQRAAIARHCPPVNLPRATRILDSLLRDELNHVAYTAILIEQRAAMGSTKTFEGLFCQRVCDFNRITTTELASATFAVCATCTQ